MHKINKALLQSATLGIAALSLAACVVEPAPAAYAPAPVAAGPAPYYGCCSYYPDYPPYYYAGPTIGVGVGYYGGGRYYGGGHGPGWGYHHWR